MNRSALRPPNANFLGDDVIGSAMQRAACPRSIQLNPEVAHSNQRTLSCQQQRRDWMRFKAASPFKGPDRVDIQYEEYFSPINKKRKTSEPSTNLDSKRQQLGDQVDLRITINTISMKENTQLDTITELLKIDEEKQRERRSDAQRKYRLKKEAHETELKTDVQQLRHDLKMLQRQRCSVNIAKVANKHVWNVAIEYFSLFRHGLNLNTSIDTATQIGTQLRFVKATMAPDVAFNGGFGSVELVKSWGFLHGSTTWKWISSMQRSKARILS